MLTRQGFIDLFWEELRNARKDNPGITREEVFDSMNEAYAEVLGYLDMLIIIIFVIVFIKGKPPLKVSKSVF